MKATGTSVLLSLLLLLSFFSGKLYFCSLERNFMTRATSESLDQRMTGLKRKLSK